ncbi:hypothetical protein NGRA_3086 [Nosema granulosis]|uniref:FLYWCH-type domain-containing protein n=1 Tax=Nosema granulosis TaxID=83296 RepID=A0A9P6KY06_9MICR|nr:hypothetical protein NGRA_3086 [Nosema granulosis]
MENNFSKIKNTKINENVTYNHYEYNLSNKDDTLETWRCVDRTCKGRIILDLVSSEITVMVEHSHSPPVFNLTRKKNNRQIIMYAETTEYSPAKIYDLIIEGLSSFDTFLIKKKNVYKLVRDTRKRQDFL